MNPERILFKFAPDPTTKLLGAPDATHLDPYLCRTSNARHWSNSRDVVYLLGPAN